MYDFVKAKIIYKHGCNSTYKTHRNKFITIWNINLKDYMHPLNYLVDMLCVIYLLFVHAVFKQKIEL